MSSPGIQFPLTLRPVVRSRSGGGPAGRRLPYHAAVLIVDGSGRDVLHIAPDTDDLIAGRTSHDPHDLVAKASRVVAWLWALQHRLASFTADLEQSPVLFARPVILVHGGGSMLDAGVRFCTPPDEEFDRLTREIRILASEDELTRVLEPLRDRVLRQYDEALSLLTSLQDAVDSWRITEQLAAGGNDPLAIEDGTPEH